MQPVDLNVFSERLNSESDRACAVLGAALLDAKLEDLFRKKLQCFHKELLGNSSPIGTFSSRIKLARALDWISEEARRDLDVVRGIRNDFAHSFDHSLSFSDQSVSARCGNLMTAQALIDGFELAAKVPNNKLSPEAVYEMQAAFEPPRMRYELAVSFLAQYLDEVPDDKSHYSGADILADVMSISAGVRREMVPIGSVVLPADEP